MSATVAALFVSPVKSLRVVSLERARIGPHGIEGDRGFVLAGADGKLVSLRQVPSLAQVQVVRDGASFALAVPGAATAPLGEEGEPLEVRIFDRATSGRRMRGPAEQALSAFAGREIRVVRVSPGEGFDAKPISIVSKASIGAISARVGEPLDARRFRMTLTLDGIDAWAEDAFAGREIRAGSARLFVERKDVRCTIVNLDPDDGRKTGDVLLAIRDARPESPKICFGVYATVVEPGEVAVGDPVG